MPAILIALLIAPSLGAPWHDPLYLGNGGCWRQRVRVQVRNDLDRSAAGVPLEVRIGRSAGEANLVGAAAEQVRVCDAAGVEMLYRISGPDGAPLTRGPIAAGSTLTLPVECAAGATADYYVYFDNPAAWPVPDFLQTSLGVRNGDLEAGAADTPYSWQHDPGDAQHRASWVTEKPHSGKRCLKTAVAAGAPPTWIATRQRDIHIIGGVRYVMRAWVRAQDVQGYAGWYVHVGNAENSMLISPLLSGGGGTYDWKQVSAEFVAPQDADRADLGTVLWGTGAAWFDDVTLECDRAPALTATPSAPERLSLREIGADAAWYDDNPDDDLRWDYRVPLRVMNLSAQSSGETLVQADLSQLFSRFQGRLNQDSIRVTDGRRVIPHYRLEESLLFQGEVPPRAMRTYYAYFSFDRRIAPAARLDYADLLDSPRNLVANPSFEGGDGVPDAWSGAAEGQRPPGATMGLDEPGLFGGHCAWIFVPHGVEKAWTGWRQRVPVQPGRRYLYAAWLRTEDVRDGAVQLHAHYRNAAGELCKAVQYASAGTPVSGSCDWAVMRGDFEMPTDIAFFELHLTMLATGAVWHDGVILTEVTPAAAGALQPRPGSLPQGVTIWPVNAIVKVFQDDLPPPEIPPARISAARNEKEPLQLALRSPQALGEVTVEVLPPRRASGARPADCQVGVVGYVPIDHPTSYYVSLSPPWHRKYPTQPGQSDGWPGMWPDPLLPRNTFALPADTTQPIWITVSVPRDAPAGDYLGAVRLKRGGEILSETPFTVHVWDFALPDESHVAAIYDLRLGSEWNVPGKSAQQTREDFYRFMAEHRLCPDTVHPSPVIKYHDGAVTADFTEFDRVAQYYFDRLRLPYAYTPWYFYCFGWGHPPGNMFGESPYPGEYPFADVDRGQLRPEFKRAYQACLRAYWEHMKEKGWADRCILYVSDEPFYDQPQIRAQMKALCDMIHEVDPAIPIYCSTWHHRPEWDGYLDVWGIGHYGIVTPQKMAQLRAAGDRLWFTTDGQMCTDTPYCAIERLLPHYCFKYGVEAYEFWGISWLTYDPYQFGWHAYIHQSGQPGEAYWVRYPNGDGYLAYPGAPVGHDGPVSSIRLEQAREGVEDYEYLYLLRQLVADAKAAGKDTAQAEQALAAAARLVHIPNAGGRYSTRILPEPDALLRVKQALACAIEQLSR